MRHIALVILAIWLIADSLSQLSEFSFPQLHLLLDGLALLAGLLILLSQTASHRDAGLFVLGIWLLLHSVSSLTGASFSGMLWVESGLAVIAAVLLIFRR